LGQKHRLNDPVEITAVDYGRVAPGASDAQITGNVQVPGRRSIFILAWDREHISSVGQLDRIRARQRVCLLDCCAKCAFVGGAGT
jgi:hypothetical protein